MKIKGIAWLGTRTDRFDATVSFLRGLGGLEPADLRPDFAMFRLENGDILEVFGPGDSKHAFMTSPVAGFLVDDVESARREMLAAGIEFIGEVHHWSDQAWAHFRGPDGHVYEILSRGGVAG